MTALALLVLCSAGALALMACTVPVLRPSGERALTLLPLLLMAAVLLVPGPVPGTQGTLQSTGGPAARSYRVTLAGLRLHLSAGEQAGIGGDAQQDQLYVPELPAHLLTLRVIQATGHSAGQALDSSRLELAPPAEDDSGESGEEPSLDGNPLGLVVYRDPGAAPAAGIDPDFGGTLFAAGSWLCKPDRAGHCDGSLPMLSWTVQNGAVQLFGPKTPLCPLGTATQRPPPTRSIYPLAAFAREGCQGEKPFSWDAIEPAADFLYWGKDHQLYVRANGHTPLIVVARDGRAASVEAGRRQLAPGAAVEVHLYRYELGRELPVARPPSTAAASASPARRVLAGPLAQSHLLGNTTAEGAERAATYTRLTERRSFQLRDLSEGDAPGHGPVHGLYRVVELMLDTPEQHEITLDNDQDPLSLVSQAATPAALTTLRGALGFRAIGGPLAANLPNTIERLLLPEDGRRFCGRSAPDMLLVQGPAGASCAELGRWFLLGDPERFQVRLRIAPLGRPAGWLWAMGLLVLTNLLIRTWLQLSAAQSVTLGFLELFLTFRILVAFDAAALDWRAEDAVANAWLALLWIPLPFELVPLYMGSGARVAALRAAVLRGIKLLFVLAATVFIAQAQGYQGLSASSLGALRLLLDAHAGPGGVVLVALLLTAATVALTRFNLAGLWRRIVTPPAQALERVLGREAGAWAPVLAPLCAVILLHLLLVLLGLREQLAGVRIAAFIVPLLVLGWASLDQGVVARSALGARPDEHGPGVLLGAGLALLPFVPWLVFHLAHDNGAYVYFLAPAVLMVCGPALGGGAWLTASLLALAGVSLAVAYLGLHPVFRGIGVPAGVVFILTAAVLAAVMRATRLGRQPQTWRPLPLLTAALLVIALHGVGSWASWHSAAPLDDGSADLTPMSTAAMQGAQVPANLIRIMNQAAPEAVELLGTREGYEQRGAMLEMYDFAASLTGRGWPQSIAPQELRGTHVNDTVTAVHILSPFGRLCGIGIALFLVAFVAAVFGLTAGLSPRPDEGRSRRAVLAALVLASTSLYMLLANIGVVPFTGRNFYFLSVLSDSDLLEGGLLLVIILAATLPHPEAAQPAERTRAVQVAP